MYISRSAKSRQFFARFLAAKTLTLSFEEAAGPGAAAADSDDSHYLAAAAQFQAAQLERQRSGLESNTRKQTSAAVAAVVVAAHDRALKTMLSFSGKLTIEKLCEIHGILSAGQAGLKDVGKLRNVSVRVGNKNCCLPSLVRPKLVLLCESANRMIASCANDRHTFVWRLWQQRLPRNLWRSHIFDVRGHPPLRRRQTDASDASCAIRCCCPHIIRCCPNVACPL